MMRVIADLIDARRREAREERDRKTRELQQKRVGRAYREIVQTEAGFVVIVDLLETLGFLQAELTDEDRIRGNIARGILRKLGVWAPENREEIVRALLLLPSYWRSGVVDSEQGGPMETGEGDGEQP